MAKPTNPEPILRGVFSLYETEKGDFHLSYRADGEQEDRHVNFPGIAVRMMMRKIGGRTALMQMLTGR